MRYVSRTIQAPAPIVWSLITDTATWPEWGPSVRQVCSPQRFIAQGSRGIIRSAVGLWVPFHVTHLEEGLRWDWEVMGLPGTSHIIRPLSSASCEVAFGIPALAIGYSVVCEAALRRIEQMAELRASAQLSLQSAPMRAIER